MFSLIYSKKDVASLTLYEAFKEVERSFNNLDIYFYEYPLEVVYADRVDQYLPRDVETIIFLSRHSAKSNVPTISVHTPGNFGENRLGGRPYELAIANPCLIGYILREYQKNIVNYNLNYTPTLEVTHHGPTDLRVPALFVELGPQESNWRDKVAAECIALSVFNALSKYIYNRNCIKALGIGGPHYSPNFTKYILKNDNVGIGHIISKYVFNDFSEKIVEKAISFNGGIDLVLIDWKGLKGFVRQRLLEYLNKRNINFVKL